jgi:metal-dependent amidase/aminoacylase/carboxypeptidase family protein
MAIVLGLAIVLSYGYLAFEGRVILLFQPAGIFFFDF